MRRALAIVGALLVFPGLLCAAAPPGGPAGKVKVRVEIEDGKAFKSGEVYIKSLLVPLDQEREEYVFSDLPAGRYAVSAEALVSQGWFKPKKRYLGVTRVDLEGGDSREVTVKLEELENVNDFCTRCHPEPKAALQAGQVPRDAHPSGNALRQRNVEQVARYNESVEEAKDDASPANYPILLEEREVIENGRTVKKSFYTCESCHTAHRETAHGRYARASYTVGSVLCKGCHY